MNEKQCKDSIKNEVFMTLEQKARKIIDEKLIMFGWIIHDMKDLNLNTSVGVAVREFLTDTGLVDYALFLVEILLV